MAGAGAEKNTKFRLRLRLQLLVNCKAENYEFVTTKKKIIFFPDTKLSTEFKCSTLIIKTIMIKNFEKLQFYFIRLPL